LCQSLGIKVTTGEICTAENLAERAHYFRQAGEVVIKVPDLASGDGFYRAKTSTKLRRILASRRWPGTYLVEIWLKKIASPSAITSIGKNVGEIFITDQEVRASGEHQGNQLVSQLKPHYKTKVKKIAERLFDSFRRLGYIGPIGIDFIVTGQGEIFPTEANGRYTAPMYACALWQSMGVKHHYALARNIEIAPMHYDEFRYRTRDLHYVNRTDNQGIIPYNVLLAPQGKIAVLVLAKSVKDGQSLYEQVMERTAYAAISA
jgi:hypothetical protein